MGEYLELTSERVFLSTPTPKSGQQASGKKKKAPPVKLQMESAKMTALSTCF